GWRRSRRVAALFARGRKNLERDLALSISSVLTHRGMPRDRRRLLTGFLGQSDKIVSLPGLRQNPKILWADDAKIIGDGIAEALPVLGDFVAQEIERGVRKLSACGVAFVVRDVLVH